MSPRLIHAETLYDGTGAPPRQNRLIEIADGRIRSVSDAPAMPPRGTQQVEIATPGFIDLQINGAGDVQFNDAPTVDAVETVVAGARKGGATQILPTFITAEGDAWHDAIDAVTAARARGVPGIAGLHLEGPFLSPARPGIHPAHAIRPLRDADLARLEQVRVPLLLTLAPEEQPDGSIRRLAAAGVRVFAGHSTATAGQIDRAVAEGLTGITHLWNAMPPPQGRAPGIVVRTMTHPTLFAGIIADGFHVDPLNLRLAARMMPDRLFLVTDAMRTYAGAVPFFDLMGTPVRLQDGRLTGPDGTLAGAHLGMDDAVRTMIGAAGIPAEAAVRMASAIPAKALGCASDLGLVAPGYLANLTFLDRGWKATGTIVDGDHVF
ncbi:N-acetylglucosamine-6-phosphate deacetylase [Chachezhania sediminis]|uniref:N-acetylglucosamine-6-phosphate deacetylase n=1 Tax=Chachezhania sediminis TaxID=2599291 RepID=UPI00131D401A|nr:N-acetylglucosamine-6-phosphate deacetylase [Chachezhania sediminis]